MNKRKLKEWENEMKKATESSLKGFSEPKITITNIVYNENHEFCKTMTKEELSKIIIVAH